jgi:23S rRNA (cytosine1962-C5)-methyltransferase
MSASDVRGRVKLKPSEDERIRNGHVWIYDNEIASVYAPEGAAGGGGVPRDGDLVWVEDAGGRKLGTGFIDRQSVISVRLLTRGGKKIFGPGDVDALLQNSFQRRMHLDLDCVRLVNAEGDYLPGLVIDRYGGVVVIQPKIPAWNGEQWEPPIVNAGARLLSPRTLFIKGAADMIRVDETGRHSTVARGDPDTTVIVREGGLEVEVDILDGQKTGFYIDQRENRKSTLPHVSGKRVLDCFCYSGVWSCMCAAHGAREVTGVDSSEPAIVLARGNAARNGLRETVSFVGADVFDYLPGLAGAREKYDIIILDPPSLARTRKQVAGAMRGYIHLNKVAMGLLNPGGILVTCSCSYHMTRERFLEMLRHTSTLVRKRVSVMRIGGQPEDHPSLLGVPETDYLKCVSLRVE